jgi:glycosyltransferase involved in cell wall biosynthesis
MTQLDSNYAAEPLHIAIWVDNVMLAQESAFLRHLTMGLKSDGNQITFIAPAGKDLSSLVTLGSDCLTYRTNRWELFSVVQRMRLSSVVDGLKRSPPDVLLIWGSADARQVELLKMIDEAIATPAILWVWDSGELFTPVASLPNIRHVVASSRSIADRALAKLGSGPNAIPITQISPGAYTDELTACFDVDGQVPCLVSLDPLNDRRAYEALFKACRLLADEGIEYMLFAYDTGTDEYNIWRDVERLGLLDRISFVPFQQDAEPLLLHGDLYLHAIPRPRVGYRTLEAMGKGLLPVSVVNQAADYLIDNQTCRIVHEPTAEGWRSVLKELIVNRQSTIQMARRAQAHVREHHSMIRSITQFASLARQVSGAPLGMVGK